MLENYEHQFFDNTFFFRSTNSTSAEAEKMIKQGEKLGNFLIIAEKQKSGKGRSRNSWYSPKGGLWFTIALSNFNVSSNLTIFIGVILRRILAELFPQIENKIKIKWPNDIFINDKKVSGILTSYLTYYKYHLIGIGVDTNISEFPLELDESVTSLQTVLNEEVENVLILQRFLDEFSVELPEFLDTGLSKFHDEYLQNSYLIGKTVSIGSEFEEYTGKVMRINKKGGIILRLANGMLQPFYSGTISNIQKANHNNFKKK